MRRRNMPFLYRCKLNFPGSGLIMGLVILLILAAVAVGWSVICTVVMLVLCAFLIPVSLYERYKSWRGK